MGLLYLVRSAMIISEFGNLVIKMKLKNKLLDQLHKEALYDPVDLKKEWGEYFYECIRDIAEHPVVLRMKLYPHHGHTNCYEHCLHVAYYNYVVCRYFHLDARSAARGGMLHDLFLYDWHTHAQKTGERFHGIHHHKHAYRHAKKFFNLNPIEEDIILAHMWPVTVLKVPKTKEGWITTLTDKYCGALETGQGRS